MRALALSIVWLALACEPNQSDPADPSGRGAFGDRAAAPTTGEVRPDPLAPPPAEQRARLGDPPSAPTATDEPTAPGSAPAEPPRPRDLASELRERLGDPSACLRGVPDLPDEVTVIVDATVTTTGIVTRSYARSSGLPDEAIECIRRRLDGARLRAPVENAPRTISTQLTLRRQPPPAE